MASISRRGRRRRGGSSVVLVVAVLVVLLALGGGGLWFHRRWRCPLVGPFAVVETGIGVKPYTLDGRGNSNHRTT